MRGIALAKKDGKPRIQLVEEENVVLVEMSGASGTTQHRIQNQI